MMRSELALLNKMNPLLGDFARRSRYEVESVVNAVAQFDPELDSD